MIALKPVCHSAKAKIYHQNCLHYFFIDKKEVKYWLIENKKTVPNLQIIS